MRILQYNILDGCHDENRLGKLQSWLKSNPFDVLGFNELNHWNQATFQENMQEIGFHYSYIFESESSPYFVGIASKWEIEVILCKEDEPIYHGMLHVKTNGVHFIIVHLTPFASTDREKETKWLANYAKQINEPLIVMGDFNTLAQSDQSYYDEHHLYERLLDNEVLKTQHTIDHQINYQPMNQMLNAGLIDVRNKNDFEYTIPTPIHGINEDALYCRIDYLLVNHFLSNKIKNKGVIKNEHTHVISDHYPIFCEIDM